MSEQAKKEWVYLTRKPGSSYRQLFVKDRWVRATTLYTLYLPGEDWTGMTPEEIAEDCYVPVEAVREAIAYCESNPPEIREDWGKDEALAEATGMNEPGYKYHPSPKRLSPEEMARRGLL